MSIYKIENNRAVLVEATSFKQQGILERRDIQTIIKNSVDVVAPDSMVLCEEFGDWSESKRRIDLLCLGRDGNLVVIELKRTEDGGHMELQAIRYAAMVSKMTFPEAVRSHKAHLEKIGSQENAEQRILEFLDWSDASEKPFNTNVAIVLAAAEFSKELTTAVMWLNEFEIDIRCIRLKPYTLDGQLLLNVEQIIPLPEAAEYQVRVREKEREERQVRALGRDTTRFRLTIDGRKYDDLPKRKLAFYVVQEAIRKGARPKDVVTFARAWIIVEGVLNEEQFKIAAESNRAADSSNAELWRFFIGSDELFHFDGRTYALTKMWEAKTTSVVDEIVKKFGLSAVFYEALADS